MTITLDHPNGTSRTPLWRAKHVERCLTPYCGCEQVHVEEEPDRPPPQRVRVRVKHFGWIALACLLAGVGFAHKWTQEGNQAAARTDVLQSCLKQPPAFPEYCRAAIQP